MAGSIVVGAALIFVLASAVVAFHGWPSADGLGPPAQIALSAPVRPETPIARRLEVLVNTARSGRTTTTPAPPTKPPTPPTSGEGTGGRGTVGTVVKKVSGTVSGTGAGVGTIVKKVTGPVGGLLSGS